MDALYCYAAGLITGYAIVLVVAWFRQKWYY